MKSILLGVTGSIACYKAAFLLRLLQEQDFDVRVMLTPAAQKFVGVPTFQALSGHPVLNDEWDSPQYADGMDHIASTRNAEALLVAPASADFIAKAANGYADNILLASFLAADCPRLVAPAMNRRMWSAAATQRNIRQLTTDGVIVLGPDSGVQACGEIGDGRLLAGEDIVAAMQAKTQGLLSGRRIVVSTGATVEAIDTMRVISNRSSGRMGFCVAEAARIAGAEVVVIAGQTTATMPSALSSQGLRRTLSAEEMRQAVLEECAMADAFIATAAVADFRPLEESKRKTPRKSGGQVIKLCATADILAETTKTYPNLAVVGFAAQDGGVDDWIAAAKRKMQAKKTMLFVANSVTNALQEDCQIVILDDNGEQRLPLMSKQAAAMRLVERLAAALVSRETANHAIESGG